MAEGIEPLFGTEAILDLNFIINAGWLGSRVVSVLDSSAEWPGFKSQPRRCRVTVLGKLFTPIVPLFTKQQIQLVAALLRVAGVTAGLAEMAAYRLVYDSRHTQADCQEPGSAPEPRQSMNRVWATFFYQRRL